MIYTCSSKTSIVIKLVKLLLLNKLSKGSSDSRPSFSNPGNTLDVVTLRNNGATQCIVIGTL